jgi:hypothetical protein
MARTDTMTVIARLLDDDYVHEQMAAAGAGARDAYRRVRRLPPQKAIQDKTVYDHIRQAATGVSEAARRLGKPRPEPPPRRLGLLALVLLGTGAVVVWASKNYKQAQEAPAPTAPPAAAAAGPAQPTTSGT